MSIEFNWTENEFNFNIHPMNQSTQSNGRAMLIFSVSFQLLKNANPFGKAEAARRIRTEIGTQKQLKKDLLGNTFVFP